MDTRHTYGPVGFKGLRLLATIAICTVMGAVTAKADDQFLLNLREDLTVPEHCRDTEIGFFKLRGMQTFTYGIEGAVQKGFSHEYPIGRQQASDLWHILKRPGKGGYVGGKGGKGKNGKGKRRPPDRKSLVKYLDVIDAYRDDMGFDFGSEGEVLEILAIVALKDSFPPEEFFITGGVEYHEVGQNTMGELDLMIGRNSDCRVEYVGEAKLGRRALGKAKRQLARFLGFLSRHEELLKWHGLDSWMGVDSLEQRTDLDY